MLAFVNLKNKAAKKEIVRMAIEVILMLLTVQGVSASGGSSCYRSFSKGMVLNRDLQADIVHLAAMAEHTSVLVAQLRRSRLLQMR
jgi:hypothetical protein